MLPAAVELLYFYSLLRKCDFNTDNYPQKLYFFPLATDILKLFPPLLPFFLFFDCNKLVKIILSLS